MAVLGNPRITGQWSLPLEVRVSGPGRYVNWSIFTVSVANLAVIVVIAVIAVIAVIFGADLPEKRQTIMGSQIGCIPAR